MMATSLVSRLALRGHGPGGLGGRVASAARPLHVSAAVAELITLARLARSGGREN